MISHTIDQENHILVSRVAGRFGLLRISDYIQVLMADPELPECSGGLVVVADQSTIPPFHLVGLLTPVIDAWMNQRGPDRWAFVLPHRAAHAMAETVLKRLPLDHFETRCFLSEFEARQWLTGNKATVSDKLIPAATAA
jgi:hypothetical protein